MVWEKEVIIEVPFYDVDLLEIVWHGHYTKYFDIARSALLCQLDFSYIEMGKSGYSWPIVDLHIRYPKPAKLGQKIKVKASIVEWEHRLKFKYEVSDLKTGRRLTYGHTVHVAVDIKTQEMCFVSPKILHEKLGLNETI